MSGARSKVKQDFAMTSPTQDSAANTVIACVNCRKRKRKCPRGEPCAYCKERNLECVYAQPKITSKAETEYRLARLEQIYAQHAEVLTRLVQEREGGITVNVDRTSQDGSPPVAKRSRLFSKVNLDAMVEENNSLANQDFLPDEDLLRDLVESYFRNIHPWIPMLHVRNFEKRMIDPEDRPTVINILHAIVAATVKFSTDDRLASRKTRDGLTRLCRERVILTSMEEFSVENLQALIIIAFDLIGGGRGPNTWAIVDCMTRVVEHLQLSFEWEDVENGSGKSKMFRRVRFLRSPGNWIEDEERRRVFWNVFFLDRFCSVTTGWNPSLTAHDVKRRLPAHGTHFQQDVRARTRYFNIDGQDEPPPPANSEEISSLGGLSYCVESTELLVRVSPVFIIWLLMCD